jgi:hypothetical protein
LRFFLCNFADYLLAVPINAVASLLVYSGEAPDTVHYDEEENTVYYSLPGFFGMDAETRHGIVLQDWVLNSRESGRIQITDSTTAGKHSESALFPYRKEARQVLLVTAVERETEINDKKIQKLPKLCYGNRGECMFLGAIFTEDTDEAILFLDTGLAVMKMMEKAGTAKECRQS